MIRRTQILYAVSSQKDQEHAKPDTGLDLEFCVAKLIHVHLFNQRYLCSCIFYTLENDKGSPKGAPIQPHCL
jgi:hypothetical protein